MVPSASGSDPERQSRISGAVEMLAHMELAQRWIEPMPDGRKSVVCAVNARFWRKAGNMGDRLFQQCHDGCFPAVRFQQAARLFPGRR